MDAVGDGFAARSAYLHICNDEADAVLAGSARGRHVSTGRPCIIPTPESGFELRQDRTRINGGDTFGRDDPRDHHSGGQWHTATTDAAAIASPFAPRDNPEPPSLQHAERGRGPRASRGGTHRVEGRSSGRRNLRRTRYDFTACRPRHVVPYPG
jgi:hypothetical protein